jgi:hypothetical protein
MMPMKRSLLLIFLLPALLFPAFGQTGGEGVFNFLHLTTSAKTAALGGIQAALPDPDPELLLQNPALFSPGMHNKISAGYARYLAGIGFGNMVYARDLGSAGKVAAGLQFVDYGQFTAADETGTVTGSFSASDYAFNLTYARAFGNLFTAGVSVKPVYSHLENYRSFGIALDAGIARTTADQLTTLALCVRNAGAQLTTYYDNGQHEKIIWSLQGGITHRLKYAPLRFCLTLYDLNRWDWDVTYSDPDGNAIPGEDRSWFSAFMRHVVIGAELFPENKLSFRAGYNYRRHADLTLPDQTGLNGLTAGLGINLASLNFSYALSAYYQTGMVHNFSMTAGLSRLYGK